MRNLFFAYPGDLNTPTGGYGYDRKVIAGLEALGWSVQKLPLGYGYPFPDPAVLGEAERKLAALPRNSLVVTDGLAFGAMQELAARLSNHLSLIALVHHPVCRENGLSNHQSKLLFESENEALKHVKAVVVTSPATASQVEDLFGVAAGDITVILPGTDRVVPTRRTSSETLRLLSVGTVVQRKGYDLLFEALGRLNHMSWRLDIVGGTDADPECFSTLKAQVNAEGLSERVSFLGAVTQAELGPLYSAADVFVLASRYEGYGMAYTEAIAYGLPVIGSGGGAVRDTLPDGAAIYCETENVEHLRMALDTVLSNEHVRTSMAERAVEAAKGLPTWEAASEAFARLLDTVQEEAQP